MQRLCFLLALVPLFATADLPDDDPELPAKRPRIALVLAGGGARGAAHVGVLKALEERHIPVDIITGTSMGAFVGGLYASGKSADEIAALLQKLDWNQGYQEDPPRSAQSLRKKEQRDRFQLGLNLGLSDSGQIKLPKGFLQGQGMMGLIRQSLGSMPDLPSFDALPIPFRCVATNIETKDVVVLERGNLAQAMQASMAVPGIVQPVEIDGLMLVDGGVVNNMPVDVAKAMGADIVIAVDVNSPFHNRGELNSALAILDQLSRFLVRDNMDRQKALLSGRDLLIRPDLDAIAMLDFQGVGKAMEQGEKAAASALDHLSPYALTPTAYGQWRQGLLQGPLSPVIDAVVIEGASDLDSRWLLEQLGIGAGQRYDEQRIEKGISRLYATELFERIDFELADEAGKRVLHVRTHERSWGPGYLNFRLALEDNFTDASDYQLGVSYTRTKLSRFGAEWHNELEIGQSQRALTELYWPFDAEQHFFAQGDIEYQRMPLREYLSDGAINSLLEFDRTTTTYKAALGSNFSRWSRLQLGWRYVDGSIEDSLGLYLQPLLGANHLHFQQQGPFLLWEHDTLDSRTFPRHGQRWKVELRRTEDNVLGERSTNSYYLVRWHPAFSSGNHALAFDLRTGSYFNDKTQPITTFELGGFRNLSGFGRLAVSGKYLRFASVDYSYRLFENNFGFFKSPVYLGMTLEAGNVWEQKQEVSFRGNALIKAGSIYAGVDSPLGPLFLAYGQNSEDESSFYLSLGTDF